MAEHSIASIKPSWPTFPRVLSNNLSYGFFHQLTSYLLRHRFVSLCSLIHNQRWCKAATYWRESQVRGACCFRQQLEITRFSLVSVVNKTTRSTLWLCKLTHFGWLSTCIFKFNFRFKSSDETTFPFWMSLLSTVFVLAWFHRIFAAMMCVLKRSTRVTRLDVLFNVGSFIL